MDRGDSRTLWITLGKFGILDVTQGSLCTNFTRWTHACYLELQNIREPTSPLALPWRFALHGTAIHCLVACIGYCLTLIVLPIDVRKINAAMTGHHLLLNRPCAASLWRSEKIWYLRCGTGHVSITLCPTIEYPFQKHLAPTLHLDLCHHACLFEGVCL